MTVRFQEAEFAVTEATQGLNIIATFSKLPETFFSGEKYRRIGTKRTSWSFEVNPRRDDFLGELAFT